MKYLAKNILKVWGWKVKVSFEEPQKSVICVAPHTSNWDFPIGKLAYLSLGRSSYFLIKKSWFFFPMNYLFKWMGGVPVDRTKKNSVTDQMAEMFHSSSSLHLAITPEGTRSFSPTWKMGFYHIARKANVPIQLAYIDYANKEVGIAKLFFPTGNEATDILEIQTFYKDIVAKHPHKFSVGH